MYFSLRNGRSPPQPKVIVWNMLLFLEPGTLLPHHPTNRDATVRAFEISYPELSAGLVIPDKGHRRIASLGVFGIQDHCQP